jgi:hypothetical protein
VQLLGQKLVGLPEKGRERMLVWGEELFNCFGPMNDRTIASFAVLEEMMDYTANEAVPEKLKPGSWAQGSTTRRHQQRVWLFANNPDQWDSKGAHQ